MAGPYHPRTAQRRGGDERLGVGDATAMAVGAMIGGGIFSVLGVAITLAGNLAADCFVLGGALAAVTARSYARVTARVARSGGPFVALRDEGHPHVSGWLLWLLIFGYMVAIAVYSFTFGRYAANALDAGTGVARLCSVAVVAGFLAVNLRGIRLSTLTENTIVAMKILVLGGIGLIGISQFSADRLTPLADSGVEGLFLGAATVFFAYEGFEVITYDRDDMRDPDRTLRRALYFAVAIVAVIYVGVTIGAQMLASDTAIVAKKEVAFVAVGEEALGQLGRWAAIVGAILATGSAINATLFSAARLMRDASATGEVPRRLGREHRGLPAAALLVIAAAGAAMAMLPGITRVIVIGSAGFLSVYTIVNALEMRAGTTRADRVMATIGFAGCTGALVALVVELARDDLSGLVILVGLAGALAAARLVYERRAVSWREPP